jgi:hypothetical protein
MKINIFGLSSLREQKMSVIELPSKLVDCPSKVKELSNDEKTKASNLIDAILTRSWETIYNILTENQKSGLYDYTNESGETALTYALSYGMVNLAIDLINRMTTLSIGAPSLTSIKNGIDPVNQKKLINAIIRSGKLDFKFVSERQSQKNTALTYICRLGLDFEDEALFIITSSLDYNINFADETGNTALLIAAEKKMNRVAEKLLNNPKCNLSVVNSSGHFVEYYLKANKNYEMLVKLKGKNYPLALDINKSIPWIDTDKFYDWYLSVSHKDLIVQLNQIRRSMNEILHDDDNGECPSPSRLRTR